MIDTSQMRLEVKELGQIAQEFRETYNPKPDEVLTYLGLEHVEQGTLRIIGKGKSSDTRSTKLKFKSGDVLFVKMRPYFRKVVMPRFEGVCSSEISVIRAKEGYDQMFVYYLLASQEFVDRVNATTQGTGMPRAKWEVMSRMKILVPPLEMQSKIGKLLASFDYLIENNVKRIKLLERTAQLIYKEWFVNFRFPGHEKAEMVESGTELGSIPKGWETPIFTEKVDVMSGGTPKTSMPEYWDGEIPFFTPKDVDSAFYTLKTEKKITTLGLSKCNSKLYPKNTVFITARGTVGKCALAPSEMAMNQSCYALSSTRNEVSNLYLYLFVLGLVEGLKKQTIGGVFDTITVATF